MKTYRNYKELFQTEMSAFPEPDPANWEKIRKRMQKKDLWHSKKIIFGGLLFISGILLTTVLLLHKNNTALSPQPSFTTSENHTVPHTGITSITERKNIGSGGENQTAQIITNAPAVTKSSLTIDKSPEIGITPETDIMATSDESPAIERTMNPSHEETIIQKNCIPREITVSNQDQDLFSSQKKQPDNIISDNHNTAQIQPSEPDDSLQISFPSAFTPNGDGLNDQYKPSISGKTTQYILRIYNSSQQLLFQTTTYDDAWDGTYRGKEQPHGLYLYICSCVDEFGRKYSMKGEFLLLKH